MFDLRHAAGTLAAQTGATTRELMGRLGTLHPQRPSGISTQPNGATGGLPPHSTMSWMQPAPHPERRREPSGRPPAEPSELAFVGVQEQRH